MLQNEPNSGPMHIGIILDGNRRWAKAQNLPTLSGHQKGYENLDEISRYFFQKHNVKWLSAFIFSTENWNRSQKEVSYLMRLVKKALNQYLDSAMKDNIRILVLGSREKLSISVLGAIEKAETVTARNKSGTLALCFNYGGQQEIVDAASKLINSGLKNEKIDIETFSKYLYGPEVPPIDLLIRTSGEQRLSGFMLWRAAYAELLFVDKHWPEFSKEDADVAIYDFSNRHRRFGK